MTQKDELPLDDEINKLEEVDPELINSAKVQLQIANYSIEAEKLIEKCLRLLDPDDNYAYQISLGLLTRLLKLYKSTKRNILEADNSASAIMIRCLYETGLTIEYLMVHFDEITFQDFILSDAMRRRDFINYITLSKAYKTEAERNQLVEFLEKSIKDDDLLLSELPKGTPASCLPKLSHRGMAKELGGEAWEKYNMLYTAGSSIIHPSWNDLQRYHLKQSEKDPGMIVPNLETSERVFFDLTLIVCLTMRTCSVYAQRYSNDDGDLVAKIESLHKNLHNIAGKS